MMATRKENRRRPAGLLGEGSNGSNGQGGVTAEGLARGLAWFSIGLGLAEILAPRGMAKLAGARRGNTTLMRLLGLREIAHGVAIFAQGRRPAAALWSRVAGDAIDLACLAGVFAKPDTNKGLAAFATANVLGVAALDVLGAQLLSEGPAATAGAGPVHAVTTLVINRSPEELYQHWHDFENLPRFMHHLESVRVTGEGRSHWVAKAPAGMSVEWDAVVTEDVPNERIAWRSLPGADVENSGSVSFEEAVGGRGTIVRVELTYSPPGGFIGKWAARFLGEEPERQALSDLRRFKQLMETGEVVISDASLLGTGLSEQRPGQPPDDASLAAAAGRS
jgi:uncharacterized membrane protein